MQEVIDVNRAQADRIVTALEVYFAAKQVVVAGTQTDGRQVAKARHALVEALVAQGMLRPAASVSGG